MNWEFDEALDAELLLDADYRTANTITIDHGSVDGATATIEMLDGAIVGITINTGPFALLHYQRP